MSFIPAKVLETINTCLENNFNLGDICVLVRKKKEGVAIANYLSQQGIPIISSETLLIYNAPEVAFINDMLDLINSTKNNEIKIRVLDYLAMYLMLMINMLFLTITFIYQ